MIHVIATPLLAGLLAATVATQDPSQEKQGRPADRPPQKLEEWPPLDAAGKRRVSGLIGQLRKEDEKLRQKALDGLEAMGDAVAPLLLRRLTDNPVNLNDELQQVLDEVVGRQHAALLAREARTRKVAERRYVVRRLAGFADPDMAPVLEHATEDKDENVAFYGALGLVGLGRVEALPAVFKRCKSDWQEEDELVARVLPHARGKAPTQWVVKRIGQGTTTDKITGLRMLRYLAPREYAATIAVHLDAEQHAVKKEAINALRVVVDGAAPLENLSVFQAIEMAKKWKVRV